MQEFRCHKCNKLLAKYSECKQFEIKCPRCGQSNSLVNELKWPGGQRPFRINEKNQQRSCG